MNRLSKHLQRVYVPAVKDAASEQVEARNSALGKLLARTVRSQTNFDETIGMLRTQMQQQYQELLDGNQSVLDDISSALQSRIAEWAHPDARLRLQWKQDPEKSVRVEEPWAHILAGEGDFEGDLARFGHGLQRSYLLALLQELAGTDDATGPTLMSSSGGNLQVRETAKMRNAEHDLYPSMGLYKQGYRFRAVTYQWMTFFGICSI